jgi:hypothetical protein
VTEWDIEPGRRLKRVDLHAAVGGRRQGGIGPSRVTPNVLLFTDPQTGNKHGYFDGWGNDGCYHYAGEGQLGDQKMTQGNLSVFNHKADGRALRLFRGVSSGVVEYVGEFELDDDEPWYQTDAPETNDGPVRRVIMFRLRPVKVPGETTPKLPLTVSSSKKVDPIDVENSHTERFFVDPSREPYEAERREAQLVMQYADHLRMAGHQLTRHRIVPAGELKPLFTDLFDLTDSRLIEAKGTVTREAVRMAIGQLLDYVRYLPAGTSLALLVPSEPRADLLDLCGSVQVEVIWPEGKVYHSTANR